MTNLPVPITEPLYVVDTHALIWYLLGDKKLSERAALIFQAAERGETRLILPAIVLAELYFANAKHKWFSDYQLVINLILSKPFFRFIYFHHRHVTDFALDAAVPEMHDRIIAGVARRYEAPLLTADPLITAADIVTVIW